MVAFFKKMAERALEVRRELIKNPENKDNHPSVFTDCITEQTTFEHTGDYSELDFIVYFTLRMLETLCRHKSLVLNRANLGFMEIYFGIIDNIFQLELKDEDNEEPINDISNLKDEHIEWLKSIDTKRENFRLSIVKNYILVKRDPQHVEELSTQLFEELKRKTFVKDSMNVKYWIFVINKFELHEKMGETLFKLCMTLAMEEVNV